MGEKFPSITNFFYGITFVHTVNGYDDPTADYLVTHMFEAAHRLCKLDVHVKLPLETAHVFALYIFSSGYKFREPCRFSHHDHLSARFLWIYAIF